MGRTRWISSALAVVVTATAMLAVAATAVAAERGGVAVDGRDEARILPPRGADVRSYANAGYWLVYRGGEVRVEVDAAPLGSSAPFDPPRRNVSGLRRNVSGLRRNVSGLRRNVSGLNTAGPLARLARAQTAGAATRYEAATRILGWVSRHIEYRLDRRLPQDAASVLERRDGYCTGIARLTVALLGAVGIEAREVAGYVVDDGTPGRARGYHRWIEIHYPDRGWVFSDPLSSHHFVPATYVRLASGDLATGDGLEGLLVERRDRIVDVDVHPAAASGVQARRNTPRRFAAALHVTVEGEGSGKDGQTRGEVLLLGVAALYRHSLSGGGATFVGLEPGRYELEVRVPGHQVVRRDVELPDRLAESVRLRLAAFAAPLKR